MKKIGKSIVLAVILIFLGSGIAMAGDAEVEQLKQQVQQLTRSMAELEQDKRAEEASEESEKKLSLNGVLAGAYQYQDVSDDPEAKNTGDGYLPFQPEIGYTPTDRDEIFFKLGFTAGKGLGEDAAFNLAPWAAPTEDDVKDINGRNRDYLLEAWYKHTFEFTENNTLGLTFGILDATGYLDENAYANDEYTQFMNEALVNGPNGFAPSWDIGGAFQWAYNAVTLNGIIMQIGENDDGNEYTFGGLQFGYTLETALGEGNYRLIMEWGSKDFLNPEGDSLYGRELMFLSCDQQFGDIFGGWIRFGWGTDDCCVTYSNLYSGGINISGSLWGREQDNWGIGYGYIDGGNDEIESTQVFETYVNFGLSEYFALTLDVQYMVDDYFDSSNDPKGWVLGLRGVTEF